MAISLPTVFQRIAVAATGLAILGATLVGAPASQVLAADGQTVTVTGFPDRAQAGQDATFSVSLSGFTPTDPDGAGTVDRIFQVELSVSEGNGTLTLKTQEGTSESPGVARDNASRIRFTGTLAAVNAAMNDMTYRPATAGAVVLTVSASHIPLPIVPAGHSTTYNSSTPVRWVGIGANGHFYEYVSMKTGSTSWTAARDAAAERTLLGRPGYLATLTTEEENAFVATQILAPSIWIGASDDLTEVNAARAIRSTESVPLPAFESQSGTNPVEGKWHWVTGPEAGIQFMESNSTGTTATAGRDLCVRSGTTYYQGVKTAGQFSSWACGEPNNATHGSETENFAVTNWSGTVGAWNDLPKSYAVTGFLVEYSGFAAPESAGVTASTTAFSTPDTPTISSIVEGNQSLTVNVTVGGDGGSALTNFQYSTDNGATFRAFDPAVTTSPLTISTLSSDGTTALSNGTTYQIQLKAVNAAGASSATGSTSGTPTAQKPSAPVISAVSAGNQALTVAFSVANDGGSPVTGVEYSLNGGAFQAFASVTSPQTITGLTNGTAYAVVIRAINNVGTSDDSTGMSGTPFAPPPAPAPTNATNGNGSNSNGTNGQALTPAPTNGNGGQSLPPSRTPTPGTPPPPLAGPLPGVSGNGGQPPQAPTSLVGGRPTPVNTSVVNQNQVNLQTGGSSFGVTIPQGQGSVAAQGGNTELAVQSGAQTRLSGSGLFPGSTVQVFMPLGPNGSREIAQLPVGPSGTFDGDAAFTTRPTDPPLPVGRNVLQIASLNEAGERVIVEMAINIAQSAPAPEILRTNGEIPGLTPGQSLATRAGELVDVRLTVDSTSRLTTVEGSGWSLAIDVDGDGNVVEETPDGGALISVVRGGEAKVQGTGFMPLTRADIWLFSDPTLLGSVDIDENGEFNGTVIVDGRVVPVGDHTLQIQGVGVDGFVLAANLGVVVSDAEAESTATTEQAAASVLWWVVALIALLVIAVVVWSVVRRRRGQAY